MHETFDRYKPLLGYLIFAIAIAIGFIHQGRLSDRIEAESIERTRIICETQTRQGNAIIEFTHRLREFSARDGETPAETEARDEFVDEIERDMAVEDCPPAPPPTDQ